MDVSQRHIQDIFKIDTFSTLWHGKMAVSYSSAGCEGGRRVLSEKGEAKGPEKSIQWMSRLSNLSWKVWESHGKGQVRENKVSQGNSAKSRGGCSGNYSTQCHTGSKCKRKVEGKGARGEKVRDG